MIQKKGVHTGAPFFLKNYICICEIHNDVV